MAKSLAQLIFTLACFILVLAGIVPCFIQFSWYSAKFAFISVMYVSASIWLRDSHPSLAFWLVVIPATLLILGVPALFYYLSDPSFLPLAS